MSEAKTNSKIFSKQTIIGIVGVASIALFIWFAFFLKGQNIFSSEYTYYTICTNTHGVNISSPIVLHGMKIGRISGIDFVSENDHNIKLTMMIEKKYKIPENSIASIESLGLMSGSGVIIVLGDSPSYKKHGDYFTSKAVPGIMEQLEPMKEKLSSMLANMDSILNSINFVFGQSTVNSLNESFVSLNSSLKNIDYLSSDLKDILTSKKNEISNIITNLNILSQTLGQSSGKINNVINNISQVSDTIAQAKIGTALRSLTTSMQSLEAVIGKIEDGDGSAGKLLNDENLYKNLDESSMQLKLLLEDIRLNPKRYINVTIFGKKDKTEKKK